MSDLESASLSTAATRGLIDSKRSYFKYAIFQYRTNHSGPKAGTYSFKDASLTYKHEDKRRYVGEQRAQLVFTQSGF